MNLIKQKKHKHVYYKSFFWRARLRLYLSPLIQSFFLNDSFDRQVNHNQLDEKHTAWCFLNCTTYTMDPVYTMITRLVLHFTVYWLVQASLCSYSVTWVLGPLCGVRESRHRALDLIQRQCFSWGWESGEVVGWDFLEMFYTFLSLIWQTCFEHTGEIQCFKKIEHIQRKLQGVY